jgi:hypothetical protein
MSGVAAAGEPPAVPGRQLPRSADVRVEQRVGRVNDLAGLRHVGELLAAGGHMHAR